MPVLFLLPLWSPVAGRLHHELINIMQRNSVMSAWTPVACVHPGAEPGRG